MNADVGTTIPENDILAYFVWIPRYKYKLFNASYASGKASQLIEVTFENGTPVSVNIDTKNEDGSMKSEASASGAYDMKNDGKKWHEQIDLLEEAIVENNFDLSKINITDEDGHTDAVSGVSIKVKSYVDAVQEALNQAK